MKLVFATANKNKTNEIQSVLPDSIELFSLADLNYHDDIPETAPTLEGNAYLKASTIYKTFNLSCFADDTGLEIEALNGEPGVFSARYAVTRDDNDNINLVLSKLAGNENRKARFRTVISLITNDEEYQFEGIVNGVIRETRSGENGFGYDPIFEPEGKGKTFAEMTLAEKSECSHRARAFEKLIVFLKDYNKSMPPLK
jgi:XTP/dITP diphosphohydrolase